MQVNCTSPISYVTQHRRWCIRGRRYNFTHTTQKSSMSDDENTISPLRKIKWKIQVWFAIVLCCWCFIYSGQGRGVVRANRAPYKNVERLRHTHITLAYGRPSVLTHIKGGCTALCSTSNGAIRRSTSKWIIAFLRNFVHLPYVIRITNFYLPQQFFFPSVPNSETQFSIAAASGTTTSSFSSL